MPIVKRIFLFLLTNLAVIILLNIILALLSTVFGINISAYGYDYLSIFIFALIVWFLGAFVSLFLSRWSAKRMYKINLLSQENLFSYSKKEQLVYNLVLDIANKEGIKIPEVLVYSSNTANAFATGATKNSSLVAVSSALLSQMNDNEIEAVIAHEMSHILNGDMVTMTLLQWVLNTFVIFIARVIANFVDAYLWKEEEGPSFVYYLVSIIFEILLGVLASLVVLWFSRKREFRADEGSARLVGKEKMIAALRALDTMKPVFADSSKFANFKINTKTNTGLKALFSSHPSLEERIENLNRF